MRKIHNLSNRALAFTVALAIILSSVAVCFATIVNVKADTPTVPSAIWSGETADNYASGTGDSDDPFIIENGEQLAKLVHDSNTSGKYYKITNDIYLNDTTADNWKDTAKQWYAYSKGAEFKDYYFKGTLDGDNHRIYGLYYNGDKYYVGLFAAMNGATIKKVIISESSLTSSNATGSISAFVGYVGGAINYSECAVEETVSITGGHASGYGSYGAGNITISSCSATADVSGKEITDKTAKCLYNGAFLGNVWSSTLTISNSFGIGVFSPRRAITSTNNYSTVADNYGTNVVTAEQMKGEAAKTNMPKLNWQRVWMTTENGYPTIRVITSDSNPGEVWTGRVAENYAGGDGSEGNPFLISNGEQLAKLNFDTETEGKFYKLTHDIILNDSTISNWKDYAINWVCDTANATFKGTLLGDGHTVYGLYYNGSSARAALIKNTGGTVNISRLVLDGVDIQSSGYGSAGFVGNADGNLKITECYVTNSAVSSTYNTDGNKGAGGFVGYGSATVAVEDSAYIGTVSAPQYAGAFTGNCWTVGSQSVKNSFTNVNLLFCSKRYINDTSVNNYAVFNDPAQYGVTLVTEANMQGTAARDNMPKLDWGRTWKVDENGGYPLPIFPAPDGTVGEVWTGNTAENFAGGDGSEENPFLIATGEQLLKMAKTTDSEGKFYKLIADIKLNDTTVSNWKDYARQWEWLDSTHTFKGTLDGDGHTISGLYYNGSKEKFGLFCYANGATVKRLRISNSSATSSNFGTALLVGQASGNVKFVEVYLDETNEVKSTFASSNDKSAAGFVGYGGGAVIIEDSAYLGTVEGQGNNGAFLGNLWATPIIKNSFASANLKLSGRWDLSTDSANNYGAGTVLENGVTLITADKMLGTAAKDNMPNLDWGRTWVVNESGYPLPLFPDPNGIAGEVWTGNTAVKYNGGDGTKENPYQIATSEQLLKMVLDTESEGTYYKLTYDIKLNDTTSENWKDDARNWLWNDNMFKGNFNGDGHTIDGLYYNGNKSKIGLFCYATNAVIENIVFKNSYIYTTGYAAGTVVGDANSGTVDISKCYVENGYVESTFDSDINKGAGGLVGYGAAVITVKDSAYLGKVVAPANAGAILGNCWATKKVVVKGEEKTVSQLVVKNTISNAGIRFCSKQDMNNLSDNNYSTCSEAESYVISIEEAKMKGASAMENMDGLDWKKVWKTTDSFPELNFDDVGDGPADVWTGAVAQTFESGTGTENDPYIIINGEQLAKMVLDTESADKYYKLGSNIKLNDTSADKWIYGANQWIWTDNIFSGTFDGDGYTISGLYYNGAKSKVGLFAYTKDAIIKKVKFVDSFVKSAGYAVGTVIGDANSGTTDLIQCYVENGYVESTYDADSNKGAGGLVGYGGGIVTVKGSAFIGTVKASANAGALLGNCWSKDEKGSSALVITNSFSNAGIKLCSKQALNTMSDNNYSTCEDAETYVASIAESKMLGASAIDNMSGLNWKTLWQVGSSFPVCRFEDSDLSNEWTGDVATEYASGTGTENDPYIIKTGEQLAKMVLDTESAGKFYKLGCDIKLNDTSADKWTNRAIQWVWSDNIFGGTFDGNGYAIEGLYYNGLKSKVGLFSYAKDATVKRVKFVNPYVKSSGYAVGTVVGDANAGTVELYQCYVENGYVESTYDADSNKGAGGLVGYGGGVVKVTGSAFIGTVKAPANAGAILGNCWAKDEKGSSALVITNSFSNAGVKFCSKQALNTMSDNNYSTCKDAETYVISIAESKMKGDNAVENMSSLNWKTLWKSSNGFPVCNFKDSNISGEWTGEIATDYASGKGAENDPYIIKTGEQLAKMVLDTESAGKFYKLGCSIKLNDTSNAKWNNRAIQWVWSDNIFSGTFDGDGYAIEGLYYNGLKSKVGLFSYAKDATVKNVKFINPYVKSSGYAVGTVVGDANAGTVELYQCYVENGYVESTFDSDSNKGAGGLVGYGGAAVTIEGSAYFGEVKAPANAGAFLGNCWGKDKNGKSALVVVQSIAGAGIKICTKQAISSLSDNNYSDCDVKENNVTYVSSDKMKGASALKNMPALDWGKLWKTTSGNPVCRFGDIIAVSSDVWSGNVADSYAGGNGTEANPYIIVNGEQLAKMVLDTETEGKYYKLGNDIKLNDTSIADWTYYAKQWIWTDNIFKGYFDADTHTISGLYFESTKSKVGLFCYTKDATLKRIVLDNAYVHSSGYATGALVGDANSGTLTISECYVKENSSVESTYDADNNMGAGGLVGYGGAEIKIDGCAYLGTVTAPKFAGALLGNCWTAAVVTNSFATPELKFCSKRALAGDSASNYGTYVAVDDEDKENGVFSIKVSGMKGEAAKKNMPALNWARSWKTTKDGFPVLNVGEYEGKKGAVWSGRLAKNFAGGSGTKEDPYLIATGEQLAKLVANVLDSKGKYYKLVADIYLNDISKENWKENANQWFWVSTARKGNFNGHFNGDGHVIYGMYLNLEQMNSVVYTGLFPTISDGTVIEKTGLSDCHMIVNNDNIDWQSYVGGFAGVVFYNQSDEETDPNNLPVISQCFGDSKVILEGRYVGGIVGGGARTANIDNSYFIGEVIGERVGAIIGNTWTTYEGTTVKNCYSATNAADIFCGGRAGVQNSSSPINYTQNYANSSGGLSSYVEQLSLLMMRGEAAKKYMSALDFEKIWYNVENGTPVLRIFGTTDKFSNTVEPEPIEVSFVSNGGTECEPIYGNPEDKLTLPTPEREGYKFEGWYVYKELDMKYPVDYFPYFDQILYAKWTPLGIIQDFEEYTNTPYDYGDDYEYYRPGTEGYNADYVRSGMSAMHRIGAENSNADFLINYEDMLEIGTDYKISFWVNTDTEDTKADISIVHEDFPDVFDTDSGVEQIATLKGMKQGEWQEVVATFTAKSKWLAIRTSGNASIYFEDFMVIPTSEGVDASGNALSGNYVIFIIVGAAVILLASAAVTVVLILKKRKTKIK